MKGRGCRVCGRPGGKGRAELRPYGKRGTDICFDCMERSPAGRAEALRQIARRLRRLEKDGVGVVVIGGTMGPRAARPSEERAAGLEPASPAWEAGALPSELRPRGKKRK